jgi:hypothetical protein
MVERIDIRWPGNSSLLGSSCLANHGGKLKCIRIYSFTEWVTEEGSVLSGSLSSWWAASFGLLLAWTLILAPCFFFLYLSWVLSFYKVWQGFITLLR